jgi:bifunctional DNA-binding transcriptional regulator/antitoxin component of YhaV-PrlF toxin-antitoxin module
MDNEKDLLVAFTAKQDIKQGDFVLIDEDGNQSVIPAVDMEMSPLSLDEVRAELEALSSSQPDYIVETVNINDLSEQIMDEYKDAYAALASHNKGYRYGVMYNLDEVKVALDKAPKEVKMIWYFEPFGHYFVGDISGMNDFPFIYKNEDPAHNEHVKNTSVVGPFYTLEEIQNYFDLIFYEDFNMSDKDFMSRVEDLVVAIKYYQAKDNAAKYQSIIDNLWSALKSTLFGNI